MQAAAAGAKTEEVVSGAAAADPETASMTMVMLASHRACLLQTLSHKATGILMVTLRICWQSVIVVKLAAWHALCTNALSCSSAWSCIEQQSDHALAHDAHAQEDLMGLLGSMA